MWGAVAAGGREGETRDVQMRPHLGVPWRATVTGKPSSFSVSFVQGPLCKELACHLLSVPLCPLPPLHPTMWGPHLLCWQLNLKKHRLSATVKWSKPLIWYQYMSQYMATWGAQLSRKPMEIELKFQLLKSCLGLFRICLWLHIRPRWHPGRTAISETDGDRIEILTAKILSRTI